jgi:hypothetical protein
MAAVVFQRIQQRAENLIPRFLERYPDNDNEINEIANAAQNLQQVTEDQRRQIFDLLAQARQWLENNPRPLAGRAAVPPANWVPPVQPPLVEQVVPARARIPAPAAPQQGAQAIPQNAGVMPQFAPEMLAAAMQNPQLMARLAGPMMLAVAGMAGMMAPAAAAPVVPAAPAAPAPEPVAAAAIVPPQPAEDPVAAPRLEAAPAAQPQPAAVPVNAAPAAAPEVQPAIAAEPTLWEKITAIFTRCINAIRDFRGLTAIRDFISTYILCNPSTQQPAVIIPPAQAEPAAPAPAAVAAAPVVVQVAQPAAGEAMAAEPAIAQPAVAPNANAAVAAARVAAGVAIEPNLFDADHPQKSGKFPGTINLANVGGLPARDHCAKEFLVRLWRSVSARENMSVPGRASELIDNSFREGAARQARGLAFQEIEEVQIPMPAVLHYNAHIQVMQEWIVNNRAAPNERIIAATLEKGDQTHAILIDMRNEELPRYYHYNPHAEPAALEIRGQSGSFSELLRLILPMDAAGPNFHPLRVRQVNP